MELDRDGGPDGVPDDAVGDRPLPYRLRRSAVSLRMRINALSSDSPGKMQSLTPSSTGGRPPREDPGDQLRPLAAIVDGARLRGVIVLGVGAASPMNTCSGLRTGMLASPSTIARPEEAAEDPSAGGLRIPAAPCADEDEREGRRDEEELDLPNLGKLPEGTELPENPTPDLPPEPKI